MKILHYSDRADQNIKQLYAECEILITTGDLNYLDLNFLENISPKKPAFGVYGNHDSGNYMEPLGITNLHKNVVDYNGLKWGGFQGCIRYKKSDLMYTEEEAEEFANTFPPVDILLLHAGPWGMLDDPSDMVHIGSQAIRRYVLEKRPKVVFVGHQYSNEFMEEEEIKLYRTYGARIIEVEIVPQTRIELV